MNFLHEAFVQSIYAIGNSDPNPPVGAVLVGRDTKIIGFGYTQPYGSHHAEVMAINDAKKKHGIESTHGSTLYVTLEPCNHYGKTPPCTLAIKENRIGKVIIASQDNTEKVTGAEELKTSGIPIEFADKKEFTEELLWTIDGFHYAQKYKKPRVMLKWAQTRNGWLAPLNGASGPISNSISREIVFRLRKIFNSVLVTPGTVLYDRPLLNPRYDSNCSMPFKNENFFNRMIRSFEEQYPEKFRQYNKRFILLPTMGISWQEANLKDYIKIQLALPGEFFLITNDRRQEKILSSIGYKSFFISDYNDFDTILDYAYSTGAINLMIESGPVFCDAILKKSLANFLFIFKSKIELWEKGRGMPMSILAAKKKEDQIADIGFRKLYKMEIAEDELGVYQKQ
jgi:diaminohydroxyphosphoribosylaminopyrimidine deaminase/5-amino-6-(5-phosphoribosylamino)uracil reductase